MSDITKFNFKVNMTLLLSQMQRVRASYQVDTELFNNLPSAIDQEKRVRYELTRMVMQEIESRLVIGTAVEGMISTSFNTEVFFLSRQQYDEIRELIKEY